MRIRPVDTTVDLPALDRLFDLVAECDGHRPIGEHQYLQLISSGSPTGLVVVGGTDGPPVGYVALAPAGDGVSMELAVHPLHRSASEVGEIIETAIAQARRAGSAFVRTWAFQPNLVQDLERAGFAPERELRQLRIDLPIDRSHAYPSDVDVGVFHPGADEDEWLRVNNAAFAGHPENGRWTREVLDHRMQQPWFDPEGFRMVRRHGVLAGFCWTKRHDAALGEIYVIAVHPEHRGEGLGRALVVDGLGMLHARYGARTGMLYVDAGNTPGVRMYESLGFRLDHVDRSLVLSLRDLD